MIRSTLAGLVAVAVLTGCSGGDDPPAGRFVNADAEIDCMDHQPETPGPDYTGGDQADTAAILQVFRYYVSNGAKGYCDGDPATDNDRAWAQLVVDLGGSADSVAPVLDAD